MIHREIKRDYTSAAKATIQRAEEAAKNALKAKQERRSASRRQFVEKFGKAIDEIKAVNWDFRTHFGPKSQFRADQDEETFDFSDDDTVSSWSNRISLSVQEPSQNLHGQKPFRANSENISPLRIWAKIRDGSLELSCSFDEDANDPFVDVDDVIHDPLKTNVRLLRKKTISVDTSDVADVYCEFLEQALAHLMFKLK